MPRQGLPDWKSHPPPIMKRIVETVGQPSHRREIKGNVNHPSESGPMPAAGLPHDRTPEEANPHLGGWHGPAFGCVAAFALVALTMTLVAGAEPSGSSPGRYVTSVTMSSSEMETHLFNWLEELLPIFVVVFDDQLARYIEVAGREKLTRQYTEKEFMAIDFNS